MRKHRLLPLCVLLGILFAGLLPKLDAQEGKLNLANSAEDDMVSLYVCATCLLAFSNAHLLFLAGI